MASLALRSSWFLAVYFRGSQERWSRLSARSLRAHFCTSIGTASRRSVLFPADYLVSTLPHADWSLVPRLLTTAASCSIVIIAQSAATSRSYALRFNDAFDENRDMVGLALANVGAMFTGTFVVNGSPTKTEMVDMAGGRSQVSQLTTAGIILLVLLFLTGPLSLMPAVVLSAVVFLIGVRLIDVAGFRDLYRRRRDAFWIAAITALTVAFVGVEQGILVAIAISVIDHLRVSYPPAHSFARVFGIWRRHGSSGFQQGDGGAGSDGISL